MSVGNTAAEPVDLRRDQRQILRPGQAVSAILDQNQPDIRPDDSLRQPQALPPGHILVRHAMDQSHGGGDRNRITQQQMIARLLDQPPRNRIGALGRAGG